MQTSRVEKWEKLCRELETEAEQAKRAAEAARKANARAQQNKDAAAEAVEICASIAQDIQNKVHQKIATIASRCLSAIFEDEAYELKCRFQTKRNKTEVSFVLCRDGIELDEPQESCGGGVVDIVAFALRVANLRFRRRPLRQIMILDEPFKWLSKEYRPAARKMIEELSSELGMQFIIVTHDPEYIIGKVIEIG